MNGVYTHHPRLAGVRELDIRRLRVGERYLDALFVLIVIDFTRRIIIDRLIETDDAIYVPVSDDTAIRYAIGRFTRTRVGAVAGTTLTHPVLTIDTMRSAAAHLDTVSIGTTALKYSAGTAARITTSAYAVYVASPPLETRGVLTAAREHRDVTIALTAFATEHSAVFIVATAVLMASLTLATATEVYTTALAVATSDAICIITATRRDTAGLHTTATGDFTVRAGAVFAADPLQDAVYRTVAIAVLQAILALTTARELCLILFSRRARTTHQGADVDACYFDIIQAEQRRVYVHRRVESREVRAEE